MSDWKKELKEAKELFEDGLIDQAEYKQEKTRIMALRAQSTNPESTTPVGTDTLTGITNIGLPPQSADPLAGATQMETTQRIGQYVVLGELGRGGMGTVYRARHSVEEFAAQTGNVVIKLMNPELARDQTFRSRFISEAALGRNIQHPNIVRIHDVLAEDDMVAIVMDYIDGVPLDERIPDGGMPLEQALPILEQLSETLDYIHDQGIIHRDLKPDNILLSAAGRPVILDLGIAKQTESGDLNQTSTGMALGTPLYMAPEQLDAKNATSAADRYALGLIAYQMLCGRLPWPSGLGAGEILARKFSGQIDPLPGGDEPIREAVMRMLRVQAEDRWSSAVEFVQQMRIPVKPVAITNLEPATQLENTLVAEPLGIGEGELANPVEIPEQTSEHQDQTYKGASALMISTAFAYTFLLGLYGSYKRSDIHSELNVWMVVSVIALNLYFLICSTSVPANMFVKVCSGAFGLWALLHLGGAVSWDETFFAFLLQGIVFIVIFITQRKSQ